MPALRSKDRRFLKKLIEIDYKCNIIVIFVVKIYIIYERKNRLFLAL